MLLWSKWRVTRQTELVSPRHWFEQVHHSLTARNLSDHTSTILCMYCLYLHSLHRWRSQNCRKSHTHKHLSSQLLWPDMMRSRYTDKCKPAEAIWADTRKSSVSTYPYPTHMEDNRWGYFWPFDKPCQRRHRVALDKQYMVWRREWLARMSRSYGKGCPKARCLYQMNLDSNFHDSRVPIHFHTYRQRQRHDCQLLCRAHLLV